MANQSTFQVPFPWIQGLEAVPRDQIRRNFEELTAALDSIPSVYVVVADDGTGDYDSIKEAIEAQPSATSNEAASAIWVKPGTYNDNGAGQVNVGSRRVFVFAPSGGTRATTAKQTWTFDGFTTTATGSLTFVGFDLVTGSIESWINGTGTIHLRLVSCTGSGRGVCGAGFANLEFIDTRLDAMNLLSAGSDADALLSFKAYNTDIGISSAGSPAPNQTACNTFEVIGGTLSLSDAITLGNSGGSGGLCTIVGAFLSGGGEFTSNFDNFAMSGCTTDEDTTAIDFIIDGISSSRFAMVSLSGNALHGCDLTIGVNTIGCRASVQGAYRTLTIGTTAGTYFVELDTVTAATAITITPGAGAGDGNYVVAAIRTPGGGSSQNVSIASGATDNRVLYSVNGTAAVADSNAGAGSTINTIAPSPHGSTHNPGGSDAVTTAAAGTISPDDSAAEGTATSLARSDHRHAIAAATANTIAPGDSPAEGASTSFSRADHTHGAPSTWPPRSFVDTTVGDGASTSIAITHSLGTEAVVVSVVQNSDDLEVYPDVVITSTTVVTLNFTVAPATDALRVTVIG